MSFAHLARGSSCHRYPWPWLVNRDALLHLLCQSNCYAVVLETCLDPTASASYRYSRQAAGCDATALGPVTSCLESSLEITLPKIIRGCRALD